ncbi:MAG: hypothetical protein ACKO0Z_00980 [Betaproteobacteria bacterium]
MAYKPVNADDKPKLILVSCMAVAVFAYGITRMATGGGQKAHAATPAVADSVKPASHAESVDDFSDDQLLANAVPNPVAGRDPFIADSALTSATPSVAQPHPSPAKPTAMTLSKPIKQPASVETLAWIPPVTPPQPARPATVNLTSANQQPKPRQVETVPDLPFCTLKGTLVDGDNPVAILEVGAERRFLHVGDALADRFFVKSIRLDGITVAHRTTPTLLIRLRNGKPYTPQSGPAEQTK